jgi:hypothetical protein
MATIYVVMGRTGEYSDGREWLVCAYADKEKAERHAFDAAKRALAFRKTKCPHDEAMSEACDECGRHFTYEPHMTRMWMGLLDPMAERMDYTGSDYVALPVEFLP